MALSWPQVLRDANIRLINQGMRTFTLYIIFLIIAALILSFAFLPRPRPPQILIVREPVPSPVRQLTYNPWATEDSMGLREQTLTSRMEKQSYDLREGLTF